MRTFRLPFPGNEMYSSTANSHRKANAHFQFGSVGDRVTSSPTATWEVQSSAAEHPGGSRRGLLGSVVPRAPHSCCFLSCCFALSCTGGRNVFGLVAFFREAEFLRFYGRQDFKSLSLSDLSTPNFSPHGKMLKITTHSRCGVQMCQYILCKF